MPSIQQKPVAIRYNLCRRLQQTITLITVITLTIGCGAPPQNDNACQPDCFGKSCGDDGCGNSCGSCESGESCSEEGDCQEQNDGCPDNAHREGQFCPCDTGYVQAEDGCVLEQTPQCGDNAHLEENACVCDSGFHQEAEGCVPDQGNPCPANSHLEGQFCACDEGYVETTNGCEPVQTDCPANSHMGNNGCVCDQGYQFNASQTACEPVQTQCPANSHMGNNGCVCDQGYQFNANQTACEPAQTQCPDNSHMGTDGCVCDQGYQLNSSHTGCEPVAAFSEQQKVLSLITFGTGAGTGELCTELIDTALQAVWSASEQMGGYATFTGTLTQQGENYIYSAAPADKLVVAFANGMAIEFTFTTFNGYVEGNWDDFVCSHNLDFTAFVQGSLNLRIQSQTTPVNPTEAGYENRVEFNRNISGTVLFEQENLDVDIDHTGSREWAIDSRFSLYDYSEQYSGTASTATYSIQVSDSGFSHISHDAELARHIENHQLWNNSSATLAGSTYQFNNAHVSWAKGSLLNDPGVTDVVVDTDYWVAQGQLLQDGNVLGTVQFNDGVVADSHGPDLVLQVGSQEVLLHTLIQYP